MRVRVSTRQAREGGSQQECGGGEKESPALWQVAEARLPPLYVLSARSTGAHTEGMDRQLLAGRAGSCPALLASLHPTPSIISAIQCEW